VEGEQDAVELGRGLQAADHLGHQGLEGLGLDGAFGGGAGDQRGIEVEAELTGALDVAGDGGVVVATLAQELVGGERGGGAEVGQSGFGGEEGIRFVADAGYGDAGRVWAGRDRAAARIKRRVFTIRSSILDGTKSGRTAWDPRPARD